MRKSLSDPVTGAVEPSGVTTPPVAGKRPRRRLRRALWSSLAVLGTVVVLVFVAGGWYFAGQIRSGALVPDPAAAMPAYNDAKVTGVSAGHVRLRAIGDRTALVSHELYGIAWRGGIGRLGASVTVSGDVVTRPLTVTEGSGPQVGQDVALDRAYFLGDPRTALGIPVRDVIVPGPLGPLPSWYIPGRGSTFVVAVHGQNGSRADVLRIIDIVHRLGFPALAVSYRNDLGAYRDPSGYLRYGQSEWRDLQAAVRWALSHGARHVVLVGQSMGGAIVASFLEHSSLAGKVTRVVLDAPMLDFRAVVGYQAGRRSLPLIGTGVPAPLTWTAEELAAARFGVNWSATDYLGNTSWLKVPALVTHGANDTRVPVSVSARLKELRPSLVTFVRFPGAGHLESWNSDLPRYTALLESFLAPVAP